MLTSNLETLFSNNNIKLEAMYNIMHEQILLNIFFRIVNYLDNKENYFKFKQDLRSKSDKIAEAIFFENFIENFTKLKLNKDELDYIVKYIKHYFNKNDTRKTINLDQKNKILEYQNHSCKYCGEKIDIKTGHLDHIIPFLAVGDEIKDNYQYLCQKCNTSKGARLNYIINMICDNRLE